MTAVAVVFSAASLVSSLRAISATAWRRLPGRTSADPSISVPIHSRRWPEGHSFGNLFLSALTAITGNLETAITASSKVLAVQGQVVPATSADVRLWAELENGERLEGESCIGQATSPIVRLGCTPARPAALPRALEAIAHADMIVLGPGSLYTSLLPNLLVPELVEAIGATSTAALHLQSDDPTG